MMRGYHSQPVVPPNLDSQAAGAISQGPGRPGRLSPSVGDDSEGFGARLVGPPRSSTSRAGARLPRFPFVAAIAAGAADVVGSGAGR